MKIKRSGAVTFISGQDGPTSVFLASNPSDRRLTWKEKFKKKRFQQKRARIIAHLSAEPHTLDEVITYIENTYHARELDSNSSHCCEDKKSLKASLILQYSPHLADTPLRDFPPPDLNSKAIEEFFALAQQRADKLAQIPDHIFPMDYHYYIIEFTEAGHITITIEKLHHILSIGYSCNGGKKIQKELERIQKDIYLYYGVAKEDILNKSSRFNQLVAILTQHH